MSGKYFLYLILLILPIFTKENKDSFDMEDIPKINEEFYNTKIYDYPNKKWFIVFVVENCNYCNHVLSQLKEMRDSITEEYHVNFVIANCSYSQNFWLGLAFNLTQMPTMIYIENQKYYQYKDFFEKGRLSKFLEKDFSEEESIEIPKKITFFYKASTAFNKVISELQLLFQKFLKNHGYNITLTRNIVICIVFAIFLLLLYIEAKITSSIGKLITNLCKKNNQDINDNEENNKNQEIPNGKEKRE